MLMMSTGTSAGPLHSSAKVYALYHFCKKLDYIYNVYTHIKTCNMYIYKPEFFCLLCFTLLHVHVHVHVTGVLWWKGFFDYFVVVGTNLISSEPQLLSGYIHVYPCGSQNKLCWTALMRANELSAVCLFALVCLIFSCTCKNTPLGLQHIWWFNLPRLDPSY